MLNIKVIEEYRNIVSIVCCLAVFSLTMYIYIGFTLLYSIIKNTA